MQRFASTKKKAIDLLSGDVAKAIHLTGAGVITPSSTLRELTEEWLRGLPKVRLSEGTKKTYSALAKRNVLAADAPLRLAPLSAITPAKITSALGAIAVNRGPGAAKSMSSVYRNIFELAMRHEAITINPAKHAEFSALDYVQADDSPRDTDRALTDEECEDILAKLSTDPIAARHLLQTLMRVMMGTGARIGEACSLTWDDVDFKSKTIHIRGTKTTSSDRVVAAPEWLMGALRLRSESLSPQGLDYVCPSPLGKRRDLSNTSRAVKNALKRYGYPWATSHTFRRTVATKLDRARLTPRQIANHLGHAQPAMTLNRYMDRRHVEMDAAKHL